MVKVSVIIINYNTFDLTCNCIHSVIAQTQAISYEIILVDNASSECDADTFLRVFPSIKLIKSSTNGGFASGNNLGIAASSGEYILLLNNDTILKEDTIRKTTERFQMDPTIGVLGCRMTFPDGSIQYTARRFRSIRWELLDWLRFILWMVPYTKRAKLMLGKYFRHDVEMFCDWVNGAFFLFSRSVLNQLPGKKLDDRFFMYGEDQLWCEQIKKMGYQILFYPATTIVHINSGSTSLDKQLKLRSVMMAHELKIMRRRKGKGIYYFLFKLIYGSKELIRNLIKSFFFRVTGRMIR